VNLRAALVLIVVAVIAAPVSAQVITPAQAQVVNSGVIYGPGVVGGAVSPLGGPLQVMLLQEGGPPGSQSFQNDTLYPSLFGDLRVDLGFEYLRPEYTNRATTLVVPPQAASAFPVRGALGDITNSFAYIPRFGIEYVFPDTAGLGVGASGRLFTLQGDLRRTLTGASGSAVLNAENSLSIGSANVLEGLIRFDMSRLMLCKDTIFENLTLLGSVGGRYTYVRQDFTASLVSGPNIASLTSTQDFTGFGVTSSLGMLYLLGEKKRLGIYGLSRGSLLAGRNNRTSTFTTTVPGIAGASTAGQLTEDRTKLIPIGEFEMGVTWGLPLRRATAAAPLPPVMWLRIGFVTNVYGGLGLLDPPPASPLQGATFSNDPLVLYGFTIQAGFSH